MPTRPAGSLRNIEHLLVPDSPRVRGSSALDDSEAVRSPGAAIPSDEEAILFRTWAELLADRLPIAVIGVDATGRIELWNRAAESLLALPGGEVRLSEILGAQPDLERALAASRSGAGATLDLAAFGEGEPGLHVTLVPSGAGGALLLLAAQTAAEAHAAAQVSEEDSTRRLAALGRLSAGVAHEIRNPLSGIGTNAQVLRRRLQPEDPRVRFVNFILDEVTRLDKIIEDLLRFARPPEPRLVAHDLRRSVERALDLARGQIDKAGIEVSVKAADDLPDAFVDPDQTEQVLLNVVLNAVQAMPEGGRLGVTLRAVERLGPVIGRPGRRAGDGDVHAGSGRRFIEIEVRDTGVGIDHADLPKLFEPFFTTRPSGTGLGLSTSQALVRQHGGAISLESEQGKGTVVTILIPVEKRRGPR